VITNAFARIVVMVAVIAVSATSALAWPHKKGQRLQVRFVATSTLIRGTYGPNEDTYLAELSLDKGRERFLVRLVDAYPNEAPPILRVNLTAPSGIMLRLRRDFGCDRLFGEILSRTAPGDPMAILPERLGYQPDLDKAPDPNAVLPCYRTVRW
jgi:hypothetical protein